MAGGSWFYLVDGEAVGPVSDRVMGNLSAAGHIFAESLIWADGYTRWVPLVESDLPVRARPAPPGFTQAPPGRIAVMMATGSPSRMAGVAFLLGWASILILPAPMALVAGAVALRDIRVVEARSGRLAKGSGRAWFGIVVGTIGTLVLAWAITAAALR